jgi:cadmium resistance protein CadD (predicted permease)
MIWMKIISGAIGMVLIYLGARKLIKDAKQKKKTRRRT